MTILLTLLYGQGSDAVDPILVDPASSLPRTLIRQPGGFGQPGANPNVISIGAVLESQEAIAQFLQVSSVPCVHSTSMSIIIIVCVNELKVSIFKIIILVSSFTVPRTMNKILERKSGHRRNQP